MNDKERNFVNSINTKIKKYSIPITIKEALNLASGMFVETYYNDGSTELVDVGIERELCARSSYYFIDHYGYIHFPGIGVIPYNLYYFQKEILKDTNKFKKLVFLKTRQCLTEDNFVMTGRGYISIKDVKIGDKIETLKDGKSTFVNVLDSFYTGERKTCRILTNSGSEINCTLDHKVYTKRGWVEAGALTINDEIISIINNGSFGNFKLEKDEHAALIGYYLADGRSNSPSFVNTNKDYINEVLEIGKGFKNCYPYVYERSMEGKAKLQGYDVRLVSDTKNIHIERPILDFMKKFGLNIPSKNRVLTNDLMNLNKEQMSILLNRLYAGDGWISYKKDSRRTNYIAYEIGIGAPNYTLIKQIEYILQTKYGIHGYISEMTDKRNPQGMRFWKFRINQKKSVIKFINEIGIKGKTDTEEIINLISKEKPYNSHQSFEKIRKIEEKENTEDVYDITTESSDFLTNGLLVHNCGISTLFSLYAFWLGNFHESENIDVVSIKQKKAQAFTKKMFPTMDRIPEFLRTPVVKKNMAEIEWANGSYMLSESASDKAGRGDSLSLLILDELAFYRSDSLTRGIVSAAQPTLTRTGGQQILISCVTDDTYLFTDQGIKQVKDYIPENVEPGFNMIPMFKIDGMENQQSCNLFYDSGVTDTIKVTTKLGFELEGTNMHPLIIYDFKKTEERFGWMRLGNIKKGNLITLKEGMKAFGTIDKFIGVKLNEASSFVLGSLYLHGEINESQDTIELPYKKVNWRKYRVFAKYFNVKVTFSNDKAYFHSSELIEKLRAAGFFESKLPYEFLRMNEKLTITFLKGLCLGDFCQGIKSNKIEALKQIQLMFLNLGKITRRVKTILSPAFEFSFKYQEYFIDEVVKVEHIKDRHTYDFFIPKTNTFVTNGIISHNTPSGLSGAGSYYAEQVQQLQIAGEETPTEKLVTIDWFEIPDMPNIYPQKGYNKELQKFIEKDYYRNKNVRKEMRAFFKKVSDNPMANPFLKKQYDDLGSILYRQEIEHDFIVSGDQVFSEEVLDRIKENVKEPYTKNKIGESRANGLYIWKHPIPNRRYIIGVDVSTGTGDDYSSIQVMDVEFYEQVAEYKGQMATKTFGKLLKKVAKYYNEAFVVIECNSIGEAVFNEVYYSEEDPYTNVYKQKKTTKDGRSRVTGWETNVKSRQLMLNNLIDYFTVEELAKTLKVYSERLYKEMLSFVWINGRAVHTNNGHDDTLIALGLCLYFRNKANTVGESFLISEDGDFIGTDDIKSLDSVKLKEDGFDIATSEDPDTDNFEDVFGMSKEDYDWLIG